MTPAQLETALVTPRLITTDDMLETVRLWVLTHYPGKLAKRLRIHFVSEDPEDLVALPIPMQALPAALEEREPSGLQERIFDVLADGPLKTSAIARHCGTKYNGHFRNVIKTMREAGDIALTSDGKYRLADEGTSP